MWGSKWRRITPSLVPAGWRPKQETSTIYWWSPSSSFTASRCQEAGPNGGTVVHARRHQTCSRRIRWVGNSQSKRILIGSSDAALPQNYLYLQSVNPTEAAVHGWFVVFSKPSHILDISSCQAHWWGYGCFKVGFVLLVPSASPCKNFYNHWYRWAACLCLTPGPVSSHSSIVLSVWESTSFPCSWLASLPFIPRASQP